MNLVEFARFSMMTDTLVAFPARHAEILTAFASSDADVCSCVEILATTFAGADSIVLGTVEVPGLGVLNVTESARLAAIDSLSRALQGRGAGYTRVVGETLSGAVSKRRQTLSKQLIRMKTLVEKIV